MLLPLLLAAILRGVSVCGDAEDILVPGQSYPNTQKVDKDALCACLAAWGALLGVVLLKITRGWAIDLTPCIHKWRGRLPRVLFFLPVLPHGKSRRQSRDSEADSEALSSEEMVILDIDYPLPIDSPPRLLPADEQRNREILYDYSCLAPQDLQPFQDRMRGAGNRLRLSTVAEEGADEPVLKTRRLMEKLALFRDELPVPRSPLAVPRAIASPAESYRVRLESMSFDSSAQVSSESFCENGTLSMAPPPPSPPVIDPLAGIWKWPAWLAPRQVPPETRRRLWPLSALPDSTTGLNVHSMEILTKPPR